MPLSPDTVMLSWTWEAPDEEAHRPTGGGRDGLWTLVDRRPMGEDCSPSARTAAPQGWAGAALDQRPCLLRGHPLGAAHRRPLEGAAHGVPEPRDLLASTPALGGRRDVAEAVAGVPGRARWAPSLELERGVYRRQLRPREKRGLAVGPTKRGKGTKWMVVADGAGLPLGSTLAAASPGEVTLVDQTLAAIAVPRAGPGHPRQKPDRLIGDKAYDSDPLRTRLAQRGIELISPHRTNRVKPPTQDGRALRRYRRRWKIERLFAWLGHYRRLVIRYEYLPVMYGAFFHVACAMIVLRHL